MRHLSPDHDTRLLQATAVLHGNAFDPAHLRALGDILWNRFVQSMNGFERVHGEGAYSRLCMAFRYAEWRLVNQGAIHPDDLEIVEAYMALPRFTGSAQDDGVDFATPRARLTQALRAPLDKTGTPRDETQAMAA